MSRLFFEPPLQASHPQEKISTSCVNTQPANLRSTAKEGSHFKAAIACQTIVNIFILASASSRNVSLPKCAMSLPGIFLRDEHSHGHEGVRVEAENFRQCEYRFGSGGLSNRSRARSLREPNVLGASSDLLLGLHIPYSSSDSLDLMVLTQGLPLDCIIGPDPCRRDMFSSTPNHLRCHLLEREAYGFVLDGEHFAISSRQAEHSQVSRNITLWSVS